jgi:pepF/M3 family oligoendopeptidase
MSTPPTPTQTIPTGKQDPPANGQPPLAKAKSLPHWDMSVVYPGLDSAEFQTAFQEIRQSIHALESFFDERQIHGKSRQPTAALTDPEVETFEALVGRIDQTMEAINTLVAYVGSFISTDSRNTTAQAIMSQIQLEGVRTAKLNTRLTAWVGTLPVDALIQRSPVAQDHAYALSRAQIQAQHLLTPEAEELVAELGPTGGGAWGKLYGNYVSQLAVPITLEGEERELPMSAVRNLAYHKDRGVRRQAFVAELTAWEQASVPLAAALNAIKGEVNVMVAQRGWGSALDAALFQNNIDRDSLEAMMTAAQEFFPAFRRYLRAKAKALGLPKLAFYDIFAPMDRPGRAWDFEEGAGFIVEQFATFSPRMADLARRAFAESWVDAEPRPGKRDGAFCMKLRGEESRILTNYKDTFNGVSTLAHELGHAYHNLNLAHRTVMQKSTPMTLAETASIFCETIVRDATLKRVGPDEQFVILEASLQGAGQVVLDIASRFFFEQSLFEQRQKRELSVEELCDLMLASQRRTYGDGLDEEQLHPYMWAAKSHYYSGGRSFYNFPYMFGQLFALGLYARYEVDPESFRQDYDEMLSATGMYSAAELAYRFGIDLRTPDFWRGSLAVIEGEIIRFEGLVG